MRYTSSALISFVSSLPAKPYCSDDLKFGVKIYPQIAAIKRNYIQFNQINTTSIITIDLDYNTYPKDLSPLPNIVVYNKDNGRAHAMYLLENPVHLSAESSVKAQRYLGAAQDALTAHLKGDKDYAHLITKNPLSANWRVYVMHRELWSLDSLCEWFNIKSQPSKSKVVTEPGIAFGRNCYVFDTARQWAYKAIREFKASNPTIWAGTVQNHCYGLNCGLSVPLDWREVEGIAKSISKWVWKERFELTTFSKQQARREMGVKKRREDIAIKTKEVLRLMHEGCAIVEIADYLGVHRNTVTAWLKEHSLGS